MFSGRGYCTQPTCFPVLGAPPILVFLCKTHCRHMLCYKHWLSHQTTKVELMNEPEDMDMDQSSSSTVTLDSDIDEQENVPDLLKECTNQEQENNSKNYKSDNADLYGSFIESNKNKEVAKLQIHTKEIEWWNEIIPWKNGENFNKHIIRQYNDEETDDINKTTDSMDSDYNQKRKPRSYKRKHERSIPCRSYSGECPLTFDGSYGLIQAYHQHQLCLPTKNMNKKICLYQHFNSKHGFTREVSARLVRAMIEKKDPIKTKLFSLINDTPSTLFDPYHKVKCPLSTRNDLLNTPCLIQEITRKSIRRHLSGVHQLDHQTIDKLIKDMIK